MHTEPIAVPTTPAVIARPKALGFEWRNSPILGIATPKANASNPSKRVIQKQRKQTHIWYEDTDGFASKISLTLTGLLAILTPPQLMVAIQL